ncbi:hypothetical protein ACHAXA_006923 [Cyclostephanos tholiformis]|uniref:Uncharacterized protein n=1 Tax=Cyclostephanos tholiformis TaxID=382380 RepID=A0ABD3RS04_9STRA
MIASASSNLVPTALLSSGFALAFGVSFLLWRDMMNEADEGNGDDGGDGERMGDWFLSLSSKATTEKVDEEVAAASRTIRARLLLHLSVFGGLCLAGQAGGYYLSKRAPFLGLSAAAVNVHNVLACFSALIKEEGGSGMMIRSAMTWPVRSFRERDGNERHDRRLDLTPFVYRLGAMASLMRCIPLCKCIFALASSLLHGGVTESNAVINDARQLCLQVASLASLTLFAGASNALYTATSACNRHFHHHPFFATLSGMLGVGCLGVGGTMLFESFVLLRVPASAILSQAVLGGVLLTTYGIFASWIAVMGFERLIKEQSAYSPL